jgi:hypothetical protein
VRFSPAIHPQLVRLVGELDDGSEAIAAIWRELGRRARRRKLLQPSYESVRRLVHAHRAVRKLEYSRLLRCATLLGEYLSCTRHPVRILNDLLTGDDLEYRLHEYQWPRPRDKVSRARTRGRA